MKLEIELIPKNSWYRNLRNSLSKKEWDKIRKAVYKRANYSCEICNSKGKIYCHEVWKYNDISKIQKLIGFKALCEYCHYINHLGLVNVKISNKELPENFINILIEHFCKVNNCTKNDYEEHRDLKYNEWIKRSEKNYYVDFKNWRDLLTKNLKNYI